MAAFSIEVANPTGTKSLLCGCQTKMLHCDGNINIAVRLAVCPYPFLFMQQRSQDINWCFVEPRAVVARLKLCPTLLAAYDTELPRLPINGRRSKAHTFLDVRNFLFFYRFVEITAATIAVLNEIK